MIKNRQDLQKRKQFTVQKLWFHLTFLHLGQSLGISIGSSARAVDEKELEIEANQILLRKSFKICLFLQEPINYSPKERR